MANAIVQVEAPSGLTLTLSLYAFSSDDTLANIGGADTLTEKTNNKGLYAATVTEGLSGWHWAKVLDGSSNLIGHFAVWMSDTTNTHRCVDLCDVYAWSGAAVTLSTGNKPDVNVDEISDDATAPATLELFAEALDQATGQIDNGTFAAGAVDAAAIANGAIDAATFAADVDAEILSYVVDDATRIDASSLNTATVTTIPAIAADLPQRITKNTALAAFEFTMVDSTDHVTGKTGLTITATRSLDGAAFASCANSATEVSNGVYKIDLAAGDLNGNTVTLKFAATGADTRIIHIVTQPT